MEYMFLVRMQRRNTGSYIKLKVRATCIDHAEEVAKKDMPQWDVLKIIQLNP